MEKPKIDLNKTIDWYGEKITIKELFKMFLKSAVIEAPIKRFCGDSDWWHRLANILVETGNARGEIVNCTICKKDNYCLGVPCKESIFNNKDMDEDMENIIDFIFKN